MGIFNAILVTWGYFSTVMIFVSVIVTAALMFRK